MNYLTSGHPVSNARFSIKLTEIIPDEFEVIKGKLLELADAHEDEAPDLILTTGGTGFAVRLFIILRWIETNCERLAARCDSRSNQSHLGEGSARPSSENRGRWPPAHSNRDSFSRRGWNPPQIIDNQSSR